jgi:hypothetical protein
MAGREYDSRTGKKQEKSAKDGLLVSLVKWLLQWNYFGYGKVKEF